MCDFLDFGLTFFSNEKDPFDKENKKNDEDESAAKRTKII